VPLSNYTPSAIPAVESLHASIRAFNEQSSRQTTIMIRLTWAIAVLTFFLLVGLVIQIMLAMK
jgi:type IV secretory pathway component VirB8